MLKNKIPFNLFILLITLMFAPSTIFCQDIPEKPNNFLVAIHVPEIVKPATVLRLDIIITKDISFTDSMKVLLRLPEKFELIKPPTENLEFTYDGREYSVFSKTMPSGEVYTLNLSVQVGNAGAAVYPFSGAVFLAHDKEVFTTTIQVEAEKSKPSILFDIQSDNRISLAFFRPDNLKKGEEFTFTTTIKKPLDYNPSGQLRQKFTPGFEPLQTQITNSDFVVENNEVVISWQKMAAVEEISISYPVKVGEIPGGMYPVLAFYSDETGLKIENSTCFTVENIKKTDAPELTQTATSIYKLSLDFPDEVLPQENFKIAVLVQKGKNTGPGTVELNFPAGFEIEPQNDLNHTFDILTGKMIIIWTAMPANPVFEATFTVKAPHFKQAVYPLSAKFLMDGMVMANYFHYISITENKTPGQSSKPDAVALSNTVQIDTSTIFSTIDNLLDQWKAATTTPEKNEKQANQSVTQNNNPEKKDQLSDSKIQSQTEGIKKVKFFYGVQILASKVQMHDLQKTVSLLGIEEPLNENVDGEFYRYTVGEFASLAEAKEYLIVVKSKGYADAFVAEFLNGKRGKIY